MPALPFESVLAVFVCGCAPVIWKTTSAPGTGLPPLARSVAVPLCVVLAPAEAGKMKQRQSRTAVRRITSN